MRFPVARWLAVATLVACVAVALIACGNPNGTATINFTQVGACNGWNDGTTLHSAGPNAAYVVFKVHNIDNSQGKVDFAFDPSKMYVNVSGHPHMDSSLSLAHFIGVFQLIPTTIPKTQIVGLDGFSVAMVQTSNSNGSVEANQTSYFLGYDTSATDPGIILAKMNLSQTSWPNTENCLAITFK